MAERAYFLLCLALGRLLQGARYARVWIVFENGVAEVRKRRALHAPLLIWMGNLLVRSLGAGVRVLRQREWEERERLLYQTLYGESVRTEAGGTLVLPFLPGETLATLLEDPDLAGPARARAIALAVVGLAELHRRGFTHADAMAENVLVDLETDTAHWFDFETVHDAARSLEWRRADDLRALLVTCLDRTAPGKRMQTLALVLDAYPDAGVVRLLAPRFATAWERPLPYHLSQAAFSFRSFREIAPMLRSYGGR